MHLARLLASGAFPASPRRRRLLEYVVEQTLAGRGDRLKAYELAVAVLGRDASFDPQSDPIVRIEMAQLRRDLEHYYLTDGRADPIRITIPKGHYVPAFEVRDQRGVRARPDRASGPRRTQRRHAPGWRDVVAAVCACRRSC